MKQYQVVIYYTPPFYGETRLWCKYPPMTEERADNLCESIENDEPILPNGDQYDCRYMSAICEEIIIKEVLK